MCRASLAYACEKWNIDKDERRRMSCKKVLKVDDKE